MFQLGNEIGEYVHMDGTAEAGSTGLDSDGRRAAEIAATRSRNAGPKPTEGIMGVGQPAWTHSRLTCVAGMSAADQDCTTEPAGLRLVRARGTSS